MSEDTLLDRQQSGSSRGSRGAPILGVSSANRKLSGFQVEWSCEVGMAAGIWKPVSAEDSSMLGRLAVTNREKANFCIARRSGGISSIAAPAA